MTKQPVTRLALCFVGFGSCYGKAATRDEAVRICWRELKGWFPSIGKPKKDARIPVHVFDYEPWDRIKWENNVVYGQAGDGEPVPLEALETVFLNWKGEEIPA